MQEEQERARREVERSKAELAEKIKQTEELKKREEEARRKEEARIKEAEEAKRKEEEERQRRVDEEKNRLEALETRVSPVMARSREYVTVPTSYSRSQEYASPSPLRTQEFAPSREFIEVTSGVSSESLKSLKHDRSPPAPLVVPPWVCSYCPATFQEQRELCNKCGLVVKPNPNVTLPVPTQTSTPGPSAHSSTTAVVTHNSSYECSQCKHQYSTAYKFCHECGGKVHAKGEDKVSTSFSCSRCHSFYEVFLDVCVKCEGKVISGSIKVEVC